MLETGTLRIDDHYTTRVLRDLVGINSVNPSLVPGAAGEAGVAAYTAESLAALGADVATHEPAPGRISVVGRFPGTGGGRSLMLNAHYDTVGVDDMVDPFGASVRDGRLYGRGAYDMKGSLAACLGAVKALRDAAAPRAGDVLVAAVADEEHASIGTADLIGRYAVDGAIVTEPTSLEVCVAHKGFVWLEVETAGRAAHGSRPDLGIDANLRMGRVLARLDALERELRDRRRHPLLGPASLHAATLHGGTGLSTYAARCLLQVERRTLPGETDAAVLAEVQARLDALAAEDPAFLASLRLLLSRPPFEAAPDSRVVDAVAAATGAVLGRPPRLVGETPWMDSALLAAAGIDTVVIGPHGDGAHAAVEWVDLSSVIRLAEILARTAAHYCA
jgi:acetylornithine deacetylase